MNVLLLDVNNHEVIKNYPCSSISEAKEMTELLRSMDGISIGDDVYFIDSVFFNINDSIEVIIEKE